MLLGADLLLSLFIVEILPRVGSLAILSELSVIAEFEVPIARAMDFRKFGRELRLRLTPGRFFEAFICL